MNAIILSVGDELILGQTVDTNSAWLSQQLAAVGVPVIAHMTVPDDQWAIEQSIRNSAECCEVLIISGGIGPTEDDLTRQALAAVMGMPLEENSVWMNELRKFFEARSRAMPPINRIQAMIPRGADMIFNTCGTAAGIHAMLGDLYGLVRDAKTVLLGPLGGCPIRQILIKMGCATSDQILEALDIQKELPPADLATKRELLGQILVGMNYVLEVDVQDALAAQQGKLARDNPEPSVSDEYMERMFGDKTMTRRSSRPRKHTTEVFVTPGVPKEMKAMFTRDILPFLKQSAGGAVILSRTLHTFGVGESAIGEMLGDLMRRDRNPSVGTTVAGGVVSLRLNARFPSVEEAQRELDKTDAACRAVLGDLIYGADEESLPTVIAGLLKADPIAQKFAPAVATAESCTGGLVAKMLTDIPGSSAWFRQGYVTYQNEAKTSLLGIPAEMIAAHGAVSEEVARAMATGAREKSGAAYALALTGIAGPTGGTPEKPVGTVWIALAHPGGCEARLFNFPGDREMIRDRSAKMALTMLRFHLLGKKLPF